MDNNWSNWISQLAQYWPGPDLGQYIFAHWFSKVAGICKQDVAHNWASTGPILACHYWIPTGLVVANQYIARPGPDVCHICVISCPELTCLLGNNSVIVGRVTTGIFRESSGQCDIIYFYPAMVSSTTTETLCCPHLIYFDTINSLSTSHPDERLFIEDPP